MPSRIIHLAVAEELLKLTDIPDKHRFMLGTLLPDAGEKSETHLFYSFTEKDGTLRRTAALRSFRALFDEKILKDSLILGYYLHLLQDVLFRDYIYIWYHQDCNTNGKQETIHRDYSAINRLIIEKFNLKNDIRIPDGFKNEEICRYFKFDTATLIEKLNNDFSQKILKSPEYLTSERASEFIVYASNKCKDEISALKGEGNFFCEKALPLTDIGISISGGI